MSSGGRTGPPRHVPTLTEVVEAPPGARAGTPVSERVHADALRRLAEATGAPPPNVAAPIAAPAAAMGSAPPALDEAALLRRLGAELQRQVEATVAARLEQRVQEVLAPTLARITEALVLETHEQLAGVLRDVVAEAIAEELARRGLR